MSRITRYQNDINRFIKSKNLLSETSKSTQKILNELIEQDDHIPAILNLTILNTQCKKNDIKIHGYYLASGIVFLLILANICVNLDYYNNIYGINEIDNLIVETTSLFNSCIVQNVKTLQISKNGNINPNLILLSIDYASKLLPLITRKIQYVSVNKMKKTDLLCMNINEQNYDAYKKKNLLDKQVLLNDISQRYGTICKLAICLGWIFGQNNDVMLNKMSSLRDNITIQKLEHIGEQMSYLLKICGDFRTIERDMLYGQYSLNFVVNCGIKEAYIELFNAKEIFIEGLIALDIYSETGKEIVDNIFKEVDTIVSDISVDLNTQYDEVSSM